MPEPCAQRTLVKSPPELWAEVSDAAALARHLGEFGEIRITRLEPETTVVWEGDRASGTVKLEPSGWGTKVTLTASVPEPVEPVAVEPEPVAVEPEAALLPAHPQPARASHPDTTPLPARPDPAPEPTPPPVPAATEPPPAPRPSAPGPAPRPSASKPPPEKLGFFARLFGRKAKPVAEQPAPPEEVPPAEPVPPVEPEPAPQPEPEPEPEPDTQPEPEPQPDPVQLPEPEAEPDLGPAAAQVLDEQRAVAVLTGVLDDLGAAHHRPFSRG